MRVNWVFAHDYNIPPDQDVEDIKRVGASWGSWTTWRGCSTDNVICNEFGKSKSLISRAFQAVCNFYVPRHLYQDLSRPIGVKLYDGDFSLDTDHIEDIVAMHLASQSSDIVLLVGFRLFVTAAVDAYEMHKIKNYHGLIRSVIANTSQVQWVVVDHVQELDPAYKTLDNITCDKMANVLKLLN